MENLYECHDAELNRITTRQEYPIPEIARFIVDRLVHE
ncbi:MAG: hypothetical protein HW412_1475 [Bacteroidetes bacterium]|nr:hypothetical protein [Bacteroidota bacterium]